VLEFPSLDDARAWWESAEYRPLVKLRQSPVADSRAFLADGIDLGLRVRGSDPIAAGGHDGRR